MMIYTHPVANNNILWLLGNYKQTHSYTHAQMHMHMHTWIKKLDQMNGIILLQQHQPHSKTK